MSIPLDLLLVNPGGQEKIYQKEITESGLSAKELPIWAGMMATYVRRYGFSVEILDANLEDLSAEDTAKCILEMKPRLAAFVIYGHQPSASTQTMVPAGGAARALKQLAPYQKVLFVGGHAAALPERTLREEAADFVCGGEGPITISELLQALKSNDYTELRNVRDLWFWDDGLVRRNAPAPLITDLDEEMPGIAWDLTKLHRYRAHNWHCYGRLDRRMPYASIYTTLGCPYHCSFCCIQSPFKPGEQTIGKPVEVNTYRIWKLKTIKQWLEYLVERCGVENIKIADEMFILNPKHVLSICDFIIERGWGEKLNIWAYSRIDTCRPEFIEKLRAAGFRWLAFGIEAADAKVRTDVDKGKFGEEAIYNIIKLVQAADINVIANYIFGLPKDTKETMQATLDLAMNLETEAVNFYCAMAYPGSTLYGEAKRRGWSLPDDPGGPGWIGYSQHAYETLPLPTEHIPASEVLFFRDWAYNEYHSSSKVLGYIAGRFGPDTAEHIRKLGERTLHRKYCPK